MPVPFSALRSIMSNVSSPMPVLVRVPRSPGYLGVASVRAVSYSAVPIHPAGSPVTENWLLLGLETAAGAADGSYVSIPTGEFPDLSEVMTTAALRAAVDAGYDTHYAAVAYPGGIGKISTSYRYGEIVESTTKKALVFNFTLA